MKLTCLILITLSFSIIGSSVAAINKPPEKGEQLPTISLPIPKNPEERNYLGLSSSGSFKISQIKSKLVIIEIFSMYCPYCQKDAPGVNDLYRLIGNNAEIRDQVKLIGLGAGNSAYEVEVYKNKFAVPFPLFPDQDFTIHKAFGEVRTPYFIVIKMNENGTHQIVHSQLGNYPGAEPFLELVLKAAGLK
jgi:thiol-disulfide isomerase/thioredoxin